MPDRQAVAFCFHILRANEGAPGLIFQDMHCVESLFGIYKIKGKSREISANLGASEFGFITFGAPSLAHHICFELCRAYPRPAGLVPQRRQVGVDFPQDAGLGQHHLSEPTESWGRSLAD